MHREVCVSVCGGGGAHMEVCVCRWVGCTWRCVSQFEGGRGPQGGVCLSLWVGGVHREVFVSV